MNDRTLTNQELPTGLANALERAKERAALLQRGQKALTYFTREDQVILRFLKNTPLYAIEGVTEAELVQWLSSGGPLSGSDRNWLPDEEGNSREFAAYYHSHPELDASYVFLTTYWGDVGCEAHVNYVRPQFDTWQATGIKFEGMRQIAIDIQGDDPRWTALAKVLERPEAVVAAAVIR